MNINPRTLKYVLTVAEEKSFSRAAEKLYISQPSLSQHIARAEQAYGVQFFNRDVIPLTLTYAGERFITAAQDFFLLEEQLSREMEDIAQNKSGRLVIGVTTTRGPYIIPRLFATFKKEYPGIELVLKEGSTDYQLELVRKGKIDFAFVGYSSNEFTSICLEDNRLLLAVPSDHPVIKEHLQGASAADLRLFRHEPFILLHPGQAMRNLTDKIFLDYEITPTIAYETRSFDMAYRMTCDKLGITFATSEIRPSSESITFFDLDRGIYPYPLLLVFRKNLYISRPMRRFMELAKNMQKNMEIPLHL
ncbi:LysR family transcriptional regulator [Clostridium sp. MCC353]|uniref:LysR family transcriptional regulator n=1 Tax=Clostridium sp. MCC353 TaxID=2592646 RepID=UPI001C0236B2|nr:LysR family transcriptional regulator [Clostridium sp. MCC353]MBT9778331.1 LysR family transcriptional regulator [Clostridium sp. MCC353]